MADAVKLIENGDYAARAALYRYYRDHFDGGKEYAQRSEDYLPKFSQEDTDSYNARRKRAVYLNYCEAVISIYQSAIWKESPERVLPARLEEVKDDVDRFGTGANDFFQGITEQAQAIGLHFVLVDAPKREDGKRYSAEEAKQLRLMPYLVSVQAENLKAWNIETEDPARAGQFNFVAIEESVVERDSPFVKESDNVYVRVITPSEISVYQKGDGGVLTLIDGPYPNAIKEVALVPFYGRRKGFMDGESDLKKIAPLAQKVAEWLSWCDEDMIYHALRQLVIKTNSDISEIGIGSDRAIKLSPDQGEDAFILESSGAASAELWTSIMKLQDLIYRLATNRIAAIQDTAQVQSGESKKYDSKDLESLLRKKAGSFEASEKKVWELMARFAGDSADQVEVEYHRNFETIERTPEGWAMLIEAGVLSVLDWIMEEHATVDSVEDAQKLLDDNLKLRAMVRDKVGIGDIMNQVAGGGDGGEGDDNGEE